MSLDTFLSLLFGDFLVLIFTICIAIIQTKRNKIGMQQIKKLRYVICCIICIAIILSVFFVVSSNSQKKDKYNQLIDAGSSQLYNHNFLDAKEFFHEAIIASYDQNTFLQATYSEGMCHYLYAIEHSDSQHYHYAAQIYTQIINEPQYQHSEYYTDAMVDMSNIYHFLGYSWDNLKWKDLVKQLEAQVDSEPIESVSTTENLSLRLKVVYALGLYYEDATYATLENLRNADLPLKALQYYMEYHYLYLLTADIKGELSVPNYQTHNIINVADFLYTYGISSNQPEKYFLSAIDLCKAELDNRTLANERFADYVELKKNIGKGMFLLSFVSDSEKDYYLRETYQTLQPLLFIDEEEALASLMDVGYYLIRSNLCSEEELVRVLEIYEKNLSKTSITNATPRRCTVLLSACNACKWIVENYNHPPAIEVGLRYSKELSVQLTDFLSVDNQKLAEEYYAFFTAADMRE